MEYTEYGKGNDRLEMLGYDVVSLISNGKKESVEQVIKKMGESKLIHYLMEKYKDNLFLIHEGCPYNLDEWEKVLYQYSYLTFGHDVRRKMGIVNEDTDGLLVLLNIILEEVSGRRYKPV
jgi:hypothetical protein